MKRVLAMLICLSIVLLTACSATLVQTGETGGGETLIRTTAGEKPGTDEGEHNATGFQAGFGREDITPNISVPLAGYGNTSYRMSTNVLDQIYATCVAIRDEEGTTMLVFQFDIISISETFDTQVRKMVSEATGVDPDYILLNATHTHSAPDLNSSEGGIAIWKGQAYKAAVAAAKEAVADLDKCTAVSTGAAETDRLNFVRRYYKENGFVSDNADYGTGEIIGHETDADQELRLVVFQRENQKDIVMANWQCHPHRTGGNAKYDISSDIIGVMRDETEENLGVKFLFLQGGAGNINPGSRISGEARFTGYKDIGNALYEHLAEGMKNLKEAKVDKVRAEKSTLEASFNHDDEDLAHLAAEVSALWSTNRREEATALAKSYGISSAFEANAILNRRYNPETGEIQLYCYAFGDIAIASSPFEMFCQTEEQLREDSPFAFTLTLGYSNGLLGYMPAAEVWDNKGYEVATARFARGTAEQISARQLEILGRLMETYR